MNQSRMFAILGITITTLLTLFVLALEAVAVRADSKAPRVEITPEQIRSALNASGLHISPEQLELLCTVNASRPNPRLKVMAVEGLDASAARARLQCANSSICLPFYVVLRWQGAGDAKIALTGWGSVDGRRPASAEMLVHNGKKATLIFENQHMRMTQPVLCLQNGARGQQVRVTSEDRQRVWLAWVIGPGVVTSGGMNRESE